MFSDPDVILNHNEDVSSDLDVLNQLTIMLTQQIALENQYKYSLQLWWMLIHFCEQGLSLSKSGSVW